jgi:type I restriction enzyme S subunit
MDVVPNMASTYIGAKRVFKQDLVFNKLKAHLGVFAISKYDGLVSPDYAVYTPNERTYLPFMEYVFHTPLYIGEFTRKATGVAIGLTRLYTNGLFAVPFLYPPLSEQHSIVSYLDDKCAKIDKMLEGKQKQIELLAEMKQRIIADAVTRGLNPDVKMKATNIPWLPEIPEHWELRKMKYLFRERSEKNHPAEPMLSATQTHGVILQSKYSGRVVVVNTGFEGLKLVKVGDFVIHLRSFQGGIELAHDQGIISSAYTVLSLNDSKQSDYFRYLFKSIPFIDLLKTCVTGIREGQNINYAKLKQNRIPLPPLDEQHAIVSYITDKTSKINALTLKLQQEIESIKEYKQRLISDVVTGQIKVC